MKSTHWLCFASIVLALAVGGCANHVPIEGMSCPCLDGYTCCDATNQCLPNGQICQVHDGGTTDTTLAWTDAKPSKWQPLASWSSSDGMILPAVPFVMGAQVTFPDDYGSGRAITYRFAQNDWLVHPNGLWPGRGDVFGPGLVWTGSQVVYWGGLVQPKCNSIGGLGEQNYLHDGGIFDPETNTWTSISEDGSPTLIADNGFWAEEQGLVYVWATIEISGAAYRGAGLWTYDPSADRWASIDVSGLPEMLLPYFVWTGQDLLAFGGLTSASTTNMAVLRYTP
jgi:hypothetical protein